MKPSTRYSQIAAAKAHGDVRAHAERAARRYVRSHQSRIDTVRKKPAIVPPATLVAAAARRRPYSGLRRLQRQPEQLTDELDRVPVDLQPAC
jgi:hypothetical protein